MDKQINQTQPFQQFLNQFSTEAIGKVLLLCMGVLHYTFTITTHHWRSVYDIKPQFMQLHLRILV